MVRKRSVKREREVLLDEESEIFTVNQSATDSTVVLKIGYKQTDKSFICSLTDSILSVRENNQSEKQLFYLYLIYVKSEYSDSGLIDSEVDIWKGSKDSFHYTPKTGFFKMEVERLGVLPMPNLTTSKLVRIESSSLIWIWYTHSYEEFL